MAHSKQHPRETHASRTTVQEAHPFAANDSRHRPPHLRAIDALQDDPKGEALDEGLDETFPASDPVSATRRSGG